MPVEPGRLSRTVINIPVLRNEFRSPSDPIQKVSFGTSGHRGPLGGGFCERHVETIAQAVARHHVEMRDFGPILLGGDTRLMSAETAQIAAEVLVANGLKVILSPHPLPSPVFSHTILSGRATASLNATASHNPPDEMGIKYNPSHGGPAESAVTSRIQTLANEYLENPSHIKRERGFDNGHPLALYVDLVNPYVDALLKMIDWKTINGSGLRIGIHPMGGTSKHYYGILINRGIKGMEVVSSEADPTFGFVPLDHDLKIRMDPSSKYPMRPLLGLLSQGYDLVGASDPDADRYGVGTKFGGLVNPNHAMAVIFNYLIDPSNRPDWPGNLGIGRTIGTTHLLDRIAEEAQRKVEEVNVGFKYFVPGLRGRTLALAGEESAGLSVFNWVTEKDGILAVMLLAEIMARTGKDIRTLYDSLTDRYGKPYYVRVDLEAEESIMNIVRGLKADSVKFSELGGEEIIMVRDSDGLKLYTENAFVLIRGSGTEPKVKLYGESFLGEEHLKKIIEEAGDRFGINKDIEWAKQEISS